MERKAGTPVRPWIAPATAIVLATLMITTGFAGLLPGGAPTASAQSDFTYPDGPFGVRLSFTQDPETTLTATWTTEGLADRMSIVQWGPAPDRLIHQANGTVEKVPDADLVTHTATMTGLSPGQNVFYRVGGASGWTKVWEARTHPAEGEPFTVAHIGDQGLSDPAHAVTQDMLEADPDLVLIAGDLSYAEEDWWEWDEWFAMNEELFATRPVMAALGNHGGEGPFGTEPWINRMSMPGAEYYYSFDYANVHVLALQSDLGDARSDGIFQDQLLFAQEDLEDAYERREAGEIDYIAVLQHHQIYSNHESLGRQYNAGSMYLEPLLDRYQVDLVLAGHNHMYERSYPMMASAPTTTEKHDYRDPLGWIQVISGGGGRSLYEFQHPDDFYPHAAEWARRHHISYYDVDGTTLQHEAVSSFFDPGQTLGHFSLVSQNGVDAGAVGSRTANVVPAAG